jgi:acetyl-CoA carboxylase biotin carboxyl carrier protein
VSTDAVTYREVQEILRTFQRSGWTAMTLELHGLRVSVGRDGPPTGAAQPAPAPVAPAVAPPPPPEPPPAPTSPALAPPQPAAGVDTTGCEAVRSPAVGAFWLAPAPGQPPFVEVGQTVERDQQVAIVEVMKLMNPVVAPVAGEVVEVCARNAEMVEYDQVLFWIRPDGS